MTDNPQQEPQPQEDNTVQNPPSQALNSENKVPQSRFSEVVNERNALAEQLKALQAAQRERETTELAEQQRWKELYEQAQSQLAELQAAQEQATRYQSALQTTNESRIQSIPEDKRSLVPEYDDPVKLGAWLDDNIGLLTEQGKPPPPKVDGGSGVRTTGERPLNATQQALVDMARNMGLDVKEDRVSYHARNPQQPTNLDDKD